MGKRSKGRSKEELVDEEEDSGISQRSLNVPVKATDSTAYTNFPLHMAVWKNDLDTLKQLLLLSKDALDEVDPRGRCPLMLAVCLDHFECAKLLLENGAACNIRKRDGWSVVHEATCTGDVELLKLVLQHRDFERLNAIRNLDTKLLATLRDVPDFYVEMKWEFTSWIPFVSRLCPSDVCRIYKKGANVRLDTTLVGFEENTWIRGLRSFMFVERHGEMAFHEVDHDAKIVRTEKSQMSALSQENVSSPEMTLPSEKSLQQRMRTPVMLTTLDADAVHFERNKSGFLWRSDKVEQVSGQECKVFSASNVTFVTRSRTEHLSQADKKKLKEELASNPLNGLLWSAEKESPSPATNAINKEATSTDASSLQDENELFNPNTITFEEYFDAENVELGERDIGRPKQTSRRSKSFKANLWLCEEYPLSLHRQVLPIIDMMASTNAHFAKLRDFIALHLPNGFPVKIEIPLFHVLTAKITFENIFASTTPVDAVIFVSSEDEDIPDACDISDGVFEVPLDYVKEDAWWHDAQMEDDDGDLLAADLNLDLIAADNDTEPDTDNLSLPLSPLHRADSCTSGKDIEKNKGKPGVSASKIQGVKLGINGDNRQIVTAIHLSTKEQDRIRQLEEEERLQIEEALRRSLQEK